MEIHLNQAAASKNVADRCLEITMPLYPLVLSGLVLLAAACSEGGEAKTEARVGPEDSGESGLDDTGQSEDMPGSGDTPPAEPVGPQGNLLIEEVYYAGALPTAGIERYYSDQFIELMNTADAPVMVGGLIIGDAPGLAGTINPGNTPGSPLVNDPDYVYLLNAWRIPGEPEDVLLQPGDSIVIAHDASTHNPYSPVNLIDADYETYVDVHGEDFDDAIVPNMESLWYTGGYDWLVTVFGPTIIVLSMDADDLEQVASSVGPVRAPVSAVVDTMEALMDADSGAYKRLHSSVDSGFIHVSGTYTGESVRRMRDESGALIDTNDSGADFEVLSMPEPGVSVDR